jgi:hypothetical protein
LVTTNLKVEIMEAKATEIRANFNSKILLTLLYLYSQHYTQL